MQRASLALCVLALGMLAGCGTQSEGPEPSRAAEQFRGAECNGVTDADVRAAVGTTPFTRVVVNDAGCFWQEDTALGDVGLGMGISTWWYRGSDLDVERRLEQNGGRTITERVVNGNKAFEAYDGNACSIYVAKGTDVITWSIQSMNPGMLGDLCSITDQLAQLSQDRVN